MRPLFAAALSEHEALMQEASATHYLRKQGWMKVYRTPGAFADTLRERELAAEFGMPFEALDRDGALALEPALAPSFVNAVYWPSSASVTNPLALTRAYVARFVALGGIVLTGDARSLHRAGERWRVETNEGPVDAREAVVALGPWAGDLLKPMGIALPLAVKRGYHLHFRPRGNAGLTRPVVDAELGYCVAPMEQGLRLTTGAEFADRDAPPTPVQFDRLLPQARDLFPLGDKVEAQPWLGSRPCFAELDAGDRPRARSRRVVARLWPCPLGTDAGPGDRPAHGRDDDRRDAVLRSDAVCGGTFYSLTVRTTFDVGRVLTVGSFAFLRTSSS